MDEGTAIRIDRIDADILTTTRGAFILGPMPTAHAQHVNPKVGDIIIVAKGCGCQFLIYSQE
jgi:hypothetical protein